MVIYARMRNRHCLESRADNVARMRPNLANGEGRASGFDRALHYALGKLNVELKEQ